MNPRVSVTLTPAAAAVLKRLSELTGNSQSALIGELLEESIPVFERMCTVLQAARDVKGRVREDIVSGLDQAQARLEEQLGLVLETMDEGTRPILQAAERVQRRAGGKRSAQARGGTSTPMSNRGVTPTPKKAKARGKRG